MTHRVVITEFMDEAALARFGVGFDVAYAPELVDDRTACLAAVAPADAVIVRNRTQVDTGLLTAAPNLRAVGRLGVGLDNIDMDACEARGIAVLPATGANTRSVAEYVIAAALMLTRGAFTATPVMLDGAWPRGALGQGGEIAGRQLGLYGCGAIAQAVAHLAAPLGMTVIGHDPHLPPGHPAWSMIRRVSAAELLARADVLSLHLPLTPQTRNLIDATALTAMKPGAVLINTARGEVVAAEAVCAALHSGHLGGAALDVFVDEPLTAAAAQRFATAPNLILTPHIAGVTAEANARVSALTVDNVRATLLSEVEPTA